MSYDYPDDYKPPPRLWTWREYLSDKWWALVLWCALDCRWAFINRWGLRRIDKSRG